MKIEKQKDFLDNLENIDDKWVISLGEYLNSVGSGLYDRKPGCLEDCFQMRKLVMVELKRRGIYKGNIERFLVI